MKINGNIRLSIIQLHKKKCGKKKIGKIIYDMYGLRISLSTIRNIVDKYKTTGEIVKDLSKTKRKAKFGDEEEHKNFIDEQMKRTRDMSSEVLSRKILQTFNINYSASRVRHLRRRLGWLCTTPKYCQMIRDTNKEKRMQWCQDMVRSNETFDVS